MRKKVKLDKRYMESIEKESKDLPSFDEKPGGIRLKYFWINGAGRFSKRGFFFSLFAFIAIFYTILCASTIVPFDEKLGIFIITCNAAFGFNYYKNETAKDKTPG